MWNSHEMYLICLFIHLSGISHYRVFSSFTQYSNMIITCGSQCHWPIKRSLAIESPLHYCRSLPETSRGGLVQLPPDKENLRHRWQSFLLKPRSQVHHTTPERWINKQIRYISWEFHIYLILEKTHAGNMYMHRDLLRMSQKHWIIYKNKVL